MQIEKKLKILLALTLALFATLVVSFYALGSQGTLDVRAPFGTAADDSTAQVDEPAYVDETLVPTNCRYGVGYVPQFSDTLPWVPTLDAGWYINFYARHFGPRVRNSSFAPVIRVRQDKINGARLPSFSFNPPLTYTYVDDEGRLRDGVGGLVAKNPGHFWIVGNEIDVDNDVQDNMMPAVYARAYHQAYHYIKKADPTAKVAVAGLSMMTPGRLQYMSIVWDTYKSLYGTDMPVDIWNMHLYILEERNPSNPNQYGDGKIALGTDPAIAKLTSYGRNDVCPLPTAEDIPSNDPRQDVYCRSEHDSVRIFREQVYATRQWMKDRGQQNKPLLISEFSLLYPFLDGQPNGSCEFLQDEFQRCFSPQRVTKFFLDTITFMEETKVPDLGYPADEGRLVQQWLWFSIYTFPEWSGGSSNLIRNDYANFPAGSAAVLTMTGQAFRQQATTRIGTANLVGGVASDIVGFVNMPDDKGSAVLTASFRNSGTKSIVAPVTVTFYSDQALTKPIGSAIYDPNVYDAIAGCTWGGRNSERVSISWSNLPVGTHKYWAKVNSNGAVEETNPNDNVTTAGTVTIMPKGLYVPVVRR